MSDDIAYEIDDEEVEGSDESEEEEVEEVSGKRKRGEAWYEKIMLRNHTITPKIQRFILLFVSKGDGKTAADFARYFKVHTSTIATWLSYPAVKTEINRLVKSNETRIMAYLESKQQKVLDGMYDMFNNKKINPEVRRKIGCDLLGFSQLKDINKGVRTVIAQQQTNVISPYENMSDAELKAEIKMLDELREEDEETTIEQVEEQNKRCAYSGAKVPPNPVEKCHSIRLKSATESG